MNKNILGKKALSSPKGFTLLEMIVTVALAGILVAFGVPSLHTFGVNQQIKTTSFDLFATLLYARNEAVKRCARVVVEPAGEWTKGWMVKTIEQSGATLVLDEKSLRSGDIILESKNKSIVFNKDGRVKGTTTVAITISSSQPEVTSRSRCMRLNLSGLPNSSEGGCS
jgi:type IV fimbrial biogenesis protein FimT